MDFGKKRKDFKHRVKKSLQIKEDDICESIIQSMLNIGIFYAEDIKSNIDIWLTPKDKVLLNFVTYHIILFKGTNYMYD